MTSSSDVPTFVPGFHDESLVRQMRFTKLGNTDMIVSAFGLGCGSFGQSFGSVSCETATEIVSLALRSGVNLVDTAPWYGQGKSEELLGVALRNIPRQAYYLATKVGRYSVDTERMFDFTAERVTKSVEHSLGLLGAEYVDLIQVHDVEFSSSLTQIVEHTLPALQRLKAAGKVRFVGVNGYNLGVLKQIVRMAPPGSIDTVLSYCRLTIFNKDLEDDLSFFGHHGVGVINAAAVGMGLLTAQGPPTWHPAHTTTKAACARAVQHCAQKGFSLAYLALKWCLHRSEIAVTLNSVTSVELMRENLRAATTALTEDEAAMLREATDRFLGPLVLTQWENVEVLRYWHKMNQLKCLQPTDVGEP